MDQDLGMQQAAEQMTSWLSHPAELSHMPSALECVGSFPRENGTMCYIFRFKKSFFDSWRLGVVCGGGAYSKYTLYRKETAEADAAEIADFLESYWKARAAQLDKQP